MNTFEDELLEKYSRWNDKEFVKKQLLHHLDEVKELVENEVEHQYDEIIDLIVLSKIYLYLNKSEDEIKELVQRRRDKFKKKSKK